MDREKIITTLSWSALSVAGAMLVDYVVTVLLLRDVSAYTPLPTFLTASFISLPVIFTLVSQRFDLRRARDELSIARDTAVSADAAKTQFFANMSHELRTPLNAIIGFSELLRSEAFAVRREEYATFIHGSGLHLLSLVNDLLDLSRIEAGQMTLAPEVLEAGDLIAECLATVASRAQGRQVRVVSNVAAGLPLVFGDRRALKQILLNLLVNAIKFSGAGETVLAFARHEASGELALGVRDRGIGIAEEDQHRVFERFGQARHDVAGIEKGTCLGLPIVKGLVEAHGGRIRLESKPGEGTCVTFWLPAERLESGVQLRLAS